MNQLTSTALRCDVNPDDAAPEGSREAEAGEGEAGEGSLMDVTVSTEGNDGESFRCETYLKPPEGTVQQAIGWGGMGEGGGA